MLQRICPFAKYRLKKMFLLKERRPTSSFLSNQGDSKYLSMEKFVLIFQKKRELKIDEGFGELALLYNNPRNSTVKAIDDSTLWVIDRQTFKKAVDDIVLKNYEENRKFMELSDFYSNYNIHSG